MEASTTIMDYHLEERIEEKKPKIALSGRTSFFSQILLIPMSI
jgi:hypothetical protein